MNLIRHATESGAQLADLVIRRISLNADSRVKSRCRELLYISCKQGQPPGQQAENQQADQEGSNHNRYYRTQADFLYVTTPYATGKLVVLLPTQYGIQVTLYDAVVHYLRYGKHFFPLQIARIRAVEGHFDITGDHLTYRIKVNPICQHGFRRQGMTKNTALDIQQVDFDRRVDNHGLLGEQGQRLIIDYAIFDQCSFARDVHRDRAIEPLCQLFVVSLVAETVNQVKAATREQNNRKKCHGQPSEQSFHEGPILMQHLQPDWLARVCNPHPRL